MTSYNRGYAFSPIKTRLSQPPSSPVKENNPVAASGPPAMMFNPRGRYHSEPLLALNHENVSERLNHSMDHTDAKAAFKLLETAGWVIKSVSLFKFTPILFIFFRLHYGPET